MKQLWGIKLQEPEKWQNVNPAKNQVNLRDGTQLYAYHYTFKLNNHKCPKFKSYFHIFKMVRQQEMEQQLGFVQVVSVVNPPELVLAPAKLRFGKLEVSLICYHQTDEKMAVILR